MTKRGRARTLCVKAADMTTAWPVNANLIVTTDTVNSTGLIGIDAIGVNLAVGPASHVTAGQNALFAA
jgi:hypothetical protein